MRSALVAALVILSGCRQILGIDPLRATDGGRGDGDAGDVDGGAGGSDGAVPTTREKEPNDDRAQADATGIALGCGSRILADLAIDEVDFFRLDLAAAALVRIEVFETSGDDCPDIDSYLRVHDASDLRFEDDDSGIGACPAMVRTLPAGTWYLELGAADPYVLDVACPTLAGAELEPNEPCSNASAIEGTDVFVTGSHDVDGMYVDYWKIDIAEGQSIRAEIIEGGAKNCDSSEMDPRLRLYVSTSEVLDEDSGRGSCALIDGTGGAPKDLLAHTLAAGSYCLQVNAPPEATPSTASFDYRLQVTLR